MTESTSPPPRPPLVTPETLHIDDLVDEIRRRAAGAKHAQDKVAGLLDAVLAIGAELDISTVLDRIAEASCTVLDARYCALGVLDDAGTRLLELYTYGIDDATRDNIGTMPAGHGVLGHVIRVPRTLRVDDVERHMGSVGFPEGHPRMKSFLGTPIRVGDRVFGNIYVADHRGGIPFDVQDEAVIEGLAAAAGIAIEKAQMYRRARGRELWSGAVTQLTQTLLEGRNEEAAFARMVRQTRELGDAAFAVFATRDAGGDLAVRAAETRERTGTDVLGATLPSLRWSLILRGRSPLLLMSLPEDEHVGALMEELGRVAGFEGLGAAVLVPLVVGEVEVGLLGLGWTDEGRGQAVETCEYLADFADQMALAIEASRAQRQRGRALLLEDRDRIARDMHDHVIQRLYAAGLSLSAVSRHTEGKIQDRVEQVVSELDLAVKDIRHTIFELHQRLPEGGLGPEMEALIAKAGQTCGFVPDLAIEGFLGDVSPELEQDVLAVVREGLSNIARHARAQDAHVRVSTVDDLVVVIEDDGVGMPPDAGLRGLVNLSERAQAHGGVFSVSTRVPQGTLLRWRVPLRQ